MNKCLCNSIGEAERGQPNLGDFLSLGFRKYTSHFLFSAYGLTEIPPKFTRCVKIYQIGGGKSC